jgi:hypothetical protein
LLAAAVGPVLAQKKPAAPPPPPANRKTFPRQKSSSPIRVIRIKPGQRVTPAQIRKAPTAEEFAKRQRAAEAKKRAASPRPGADSGKRSAAARMPGKPPVRTAPGKTARPKTAAKS